MLTRDERYAEGFWTLAEDWAEHNSPQLGVNWKCGQEASLRVMAWCFALYVLADAKCSTPSRMAGLAAMLGVHADRIAANIEYAYSQKNNHGISEAVGLWTIGLLFPELSKQRVGGSRKSAARSGGLPPNLRRWQLCSSMQPTTTE